MYNHLEAQAKKLVHKDSALLWEHDANDYISLFMYKYADKITIVQVDTSSNHYDSKGKFVVQLEKEIVFQEDILDAPDLYEIQQEDKLRYDT